MRSALSILASLLAAATATTAVALARAPALPGRASAGVWGPDPAVFADNMVLASSDVWHAGSTPARVWGVVNAGESVAVLGLQVGREWGSERRESGRGERHSRSEERES